MPFPFLEIAGLGAGLVGSILQSREARKRANAMQRAAQILAQKQDAAQASALNYVRGERASLENDPTTLSLRQQWEQQLAHPDVLDPGQISLMKAQGMDRASAGAEGAITSLREQAVRSGLRGSGIAAGAEAALRSSAFGRNQAISNDVDLRAADLNKKRADAIRSGYADFNNAYLDRRSSLSSQLASILANRQYGQTDLLAAMA